MIENYGHVLSILFMQQSQSRLLLHLLMTGQYYVASSNTFLIW